MVATLVNRFLLINGKKRTRLSTENEKCISFRKVKLYHPPELGLLVLPLHGAALFPLEGLLVGDMPLRR